MLKKSLLILSQAVFILGLQSASFANFECENVCEKIYLSESEAIETTMEKADFSVECHHSCYQGLRALPRQDVNTPHKACHHMCKDLRAKLGMREKSSEGNSFVTSCQSACVRAS